MNIKEIIINESRPTTEGWGDDIVDFGKNVATGAGNLATRVGKAAIDPETYKQVGNAIASGAKFAVNNPGQAALNTAHAVDDAVRAGTNELTFGYADKLDAKMNSMINGTNYDDELKNTYGASADAQDRSPIASKVGEIGSYFAPVGVFNAGMKGANLVTKGLSKAVPKVVASNKAGKVAGKVVKGTAGVAGGLAADHAAASAEKKIDPNNPYLDEGKNNILGFLQKDVRDLEGGIGGGSGGFGSKAAGTTSSLSNKLRSASSAPTATQPTFVQKQQQMSDRVKQNAMNKSTTQPKTSATDTERISNLEKRVDKVDPSIGKKVANWATKKATDLAVTGALGYGAYKGAEKLAFSPDDSGPFSTKADNSDFAKQYDAARAEKQKQDADNNAQKPENNTSTPQSTDTDNGSMFSKDTFKESSTELERVKYLMGYRN